MRPERSLVHHQLATTSFAYPGGLGRVEPRFVSSTFLKGDATTTHTLAEVERQLQTKRRRILKEDLEASEEMMRVDDERGTPFPLLFDAGARMNNTQNRTR